MEKERKVKIISLTALIVAILGLTVAFAAMSQTLTINGTANLDAASWDIHFENLIYDSLGEGTSTGTPVMEGTTITKIDAVVTKPGDMVGYFFDIVNKGSINAKIESISVSALCSLSSPIESCDWDNNGTVTQEDIDKVNDNVSLVFMDMQNKFIKKGDTLNASETKSVVIQLIYGKCTEIDGALTLEESTELPKRDLKFNDLSIKINYVQTD